MIYISFLIPVYNQSEDVRKSIEAIIKYQGNDIEIVVNDDYSTEDIEGVVKEFQDERIVYYKNSENYGLDGNILTGIERCRGRFVFLFRTTDYAISDAISDVIDVIKKNPSVVYITGTCVDDDGLPRTILEEGIRKQGKGALQAHWGLHFHPSGSLFKRECIDIDLYRRYWKQFKNPKIYFMVEQLMRLKLATLGDFYFLNRPIWVYTYTNRKGKKSVINNNKVYDQMFTYLRYRSEQEFIVNEFKDEFRGYMQSKSLKMWLHTATWVYAHLMCDEGLCNHYGILQREVNVEYERKEFLKFVAETECELCYNEPEYYENKEIIIKENIATEQVFKGEEKSKQKAYNAAKDAVALIKKLSNQNISIKNLLEEKGIKRIGIYGVGYLGRILYIFLNENGIKPVFITDKKFQKTMWLNESTRAISVKEISEYEVDALVITPVQFYDEIFQEIGENGNVTNILDLFDENKN